MPHFFVYKTKRETSCCESSCRFLPVASNSFDTIHRHFRNLPFGTIISQLNPYLINANYLSNIHLTLPSPLFSQRPLTNRFVYQNSVGIPCLPHHSYMSISCHVPRFHYLTTNLRIGLYRYRTTLGDLYKSRSSWPFNILSWPVLPDFVALCFQTFVIYVYPTSQAQGSNKVGLLRYYKII